jgi:hypothetical protein
MANTHPGTRAAAEPPKSPAGAPFSIVPCCKPNSVTELRPRPDILAWMSHATITTSYTTKRDLLRILRRRCVLPSPSGASG